MTRVSENSIRSSVGYALNKSKAKLEDLQLKGSTLNRLTRPSDDPVSNVEAMTISSTMSDNKQYIRNANYGSLQLNTTEKALEQLTDILVKAKEIAISQASDFYGEDIRKNVANEVQQLRNQALSIANKRIGQRFIFGGFKTLDKPFNQDGSYNGDKGHMTLEVSKDFFVQTNLNGAEVFYSSDDTSGKFDHPLEKFPDMQNSPLHPKDKNAEPATITTGRDLASLETEGKEIGFTKMNNIFSQLDGLRNALENNDAVLVQDLLEKFDGSISRLITLRTRVGSIANSIDSSKVMNESNNVDNAARKSNLVDADIAELFSDIQRHQSALNTTYQATSGILDKNLLDFLRI